MEWSIRFTDKEAGSAAIYKFCEDGLLPTEEGSRFLKALERSNLSATGPGTIEIYQRQEMMFYSCGEGLGPDEPAIKFHSDDSWITI